MQTVILMRHAKSSWDSPALADHDRPLTDRGRRSARAMGRWLKSRELLPGEALSSSSRRTMQTFEELGLDGPVRSVPELYHADPGGMLQVLRDAQTPTVMMLGHNPGIALFAEALVAEPPDHPRFEDYPTCATLVATFDVANWSEVGWGGGEIVEFAIPREVIAAED